MNMFNKFQVLFCLFVLFIINSAQAADEWEMQVSSSTLEFVFEQAGSDESGKFKKFSAVFIFDPGKLEDSRFSATIDMTSFYTGDKDRDEILRSSDMFYTDKWPQAHFETVKIAHKKGDIYEAKAKLTLRGVTKEINFPFKLEIHDKKKEPSFHMQSLTVIDRLAFGVGQGDWSDTTWIGDKVSVKVSIDAVKKTD